MTFPVSDASRHLPEPFTPPVPVPVQRIILIVLDGVGIGALPDAGEYGDEDAHTLLHVAEGAGGLHLPVLQGLGLGNILTLPGVPPASPPRAHYGRMAANGVGKDSTTGHWEICGVTLQEPFVTFPHGFPPAIIAVLRAVMGQEPLGNVAMSGTEVLRTFGAEHLASRRPIVYTSVDSVLQIAVHEEILGRDELYALCRQVRSVLSPYNIARVIARPFCGRTPGDFKRTTGRHDFSLLPPEATILDDLIAAHRRVHAIGKISDLFAGQGITSAVSTAGNQEGMAATMAALGKVESGLIFTNLVDFDMEYGHRLNVHGFARALEAFDAALADLLPALRAGDLLLITADHGCDPTTRGTDHSREYVPLLAWQPGQGAGEDLGTRATFADLAATMAALFNLPIRRGTPLPLALNRT